MIMILGPNAHPIDTNGRPMAAKFLALHCDGEWLGRKCQNQATRALRLMIPPVTMETPEFLPLRRFTDIHTCDQHIGRLGIKPPDLLNGKMKSEFEAAAKKIRPLGFKCDFEHAYFEPVLTTTPEYRQFMQRLDTIDGVTKLRAAGLV